MKHKHTDVRASILENAEIQFAEKGYEGSSVRDIADRADINAAVIYYQFKSKEQLYKSAISCSTSWIRNPQY
ncbi:MAG TPA: helix-turn-helix domain-containing protein [Puia sp.]|jgi:AcrR family transcriptional regulator